MHMSDEPEDPTASQPPEPDDEGRPFFGQVRHQQLSARVPDAVITGVFSNGVMILTGPFEVALDFVLRLGEQQRITARVLLPHLVYRQFVAALNENLLNYEKHFGKLPGIPKPLMDDSENPQGEFTGIPEESSQPHPENQPASSSPPRIEDIYDELKLPDNMLSGRYANAVLIRHSATEFCFDFITNIYPRSAVSCRVFLAAPHVGPFLASLSHSLKPPDRPEPPPLA
jgi:hypothetical protein